MDNNKQDVGKIKEAIFKELNLEGLDDNKKDELLEQIGEVILKKIFIETMERLGDQDRVEFEQILDKEASPEEIEKFLSEKVPDFEDMVSKIVIELKEDLKKAEEE
jgi:hypothetical protein